MDVAKSSSEAARQGRERGAEVINSVIASSVYCSECRFHGLGLLEAAVDFAAVRCMREEACSLVQQGRLTPSGDPTEPQLSEQYKRYLGSLPTLTILKPGQAERESLPGLSYGSAFLEAVCQRLSSLRPDENEPLEPGTLQLACYDGEGTAYHIHEDYVSAEDYDPDDLPEHHRFSMKRRVTAILYLQDDDWNEESGGNFRGHVSRQAQESQPASGDFVDIQPKGGSMLLFRSTLPHEVLPTYARRFALSLWCHAA